jgi:hypothetical protein
VTARASGRRAARARAGGRSALGVRVPGRAALAGWAAMPVLLAGALAAAQDAGAASPARAGADAAGAPADDGGAGAGADGAAAGAGGATEGPAPEDEGALPEAHRPRLRVTTSPDRISTGDLLTLRIEAEVPEGDDVAVPEQSFAPFEVHARRVVAGDPRGGKRTFRFELDLLALEPGEHTLGPVALRVVTADGTVGRARTAPLAAKVESVLGNTPDAQPKPPTEPVPLVVEDYTVLWAIGALALVALTALVTWLVARWWGRRARAVAPPPPPRPPHEVALDKLGVLRRELGRLVAEGREQELVDRTSDALREYLGGRYGFDGLESTTDEIVARLRRMGGAAVPREAIAGLLGECDLVKFAKVMPDAAQCARMVEGAIAIVRETAGLGVVGAGGPGGAPHGAGPGGIGGAPLAGDSAAGHAPPGAVPAPAGGAVPALGGWAAPVGEAVADEAAGGVGRSGARQAGGVAGDGDDEMSPAHADRRLGPAGELIVSVVGAAPARVASALEEEVRAGVDALATDVGFSGDVRVVVGHELPDTDAARAALTAALARLAPDLAERRTARGLRLRVTLEHLLEAPREGAPLRKGVYELPQARGGGGAA